MKTCFRLSFRWLACALSLLTPLAGQATTYYVDNTYPTATDSNPGTSPTTPFLTLKPLNRRAMQPGDVIALKVGTTNAGGLVVTASGNATNSITITSYGNGAKPVITNDLTYRSYSDAILLQGANYIVIDGVKLAATSNAGIRMDANSNHNIMRNCEVTNAGVGALVYGQYNLFTNNYIHDLIMIVNDTGGTNTDNDYGANGFIISGSNNELCYNFLSGCKAPSYDYGVDGGGFELYGNTSNISIHHNWVQNSEGLLESGAGLASNVNISYNISLNNRYMLVMHLSGAFAGSLSGVLVENNTVVELTTTNASSLVYLDAAPTSAQFIYRNNIVTVNNIGSIFKNDVPRNNNLYQFLSSSTHMLNNWGNNLGPAEIKADPQFVNQSANNFRIAATSPALNAGLPLGYLEDFAALLVSATTPCLGAYEYNAAPVTLVMEAEGVPVNAPMYIASDASVSGGFYITTPTTTASNIPDILTAPSATYIFNTHVAGSYTIWARTYAVNGDNNSLYYALNPTDATVYTLIKWSFYGQWGWCKLGTVSLTAGQNALAIKYRHHGGKFDQFLLTTDPAFTPTGVY